MGVEKFLHLVEFGCCAYSQLLSKWITYALYGTVKYIVNSCAVIHC